MRVRAVDLFCGAGGLTYGLREAGIDVVCGFDIDPACRYAYETNNATPFVEHDLANPDIKQIVAALDGDGPTLVAGCAPCQRFSTYNRRRGTEEGAWPLLDSFSAIVSEARPDYVTMENVAGLERDPAFARFHKRLETLGYIISYDILDCRTYGIPQMRKRLVLLAARGRPINLPEPSHRADNFKTVRETIASLPPLGAGDADPLDPLHVASAVSDLNRARLKASRPGGTWRDWPSDLRSPCHRRLSGKGYAAVYGRMEWDQPAPTITGQCFGFGNGRFGHPEQDRALSLREAALLQTFPSDYVFWPKSEKRTLRQAGTIIGNAVPPALGSIIGRQIANHAAQL